jgi:hypothetical protein
MLRARAAGRRFAVGTVAAVRPPRSTCRAGVAVTALALLVVAGCGDGGGSADPATTTTAAADAASTSTAAASITTATGGTADTTGTTDLDGEGISELEALAGELLIRGDELGVPTQDRGYTPALPPGCPYDLDEDHPPDVHVGTTLHTDNGTFVEVLRVYPDTDAARAAFTAAVDNEPGCSFADRDATGPVEVNERVGADAAVRFEAADRSGNTVRITTRVADAVVTFSLAGQVGFVLDPVEVAAFGVGKILAALEA